MSNVKLLVVDDQFGGAIDARRDLCNIYGLNDVTGDDSCPEPISQPLADAVFCSGQISDKTRVENNAGLVLDLVSSGWPFADGTRWSLILLDLRFVSGELQGGVAAGRDGDDVFGLRLLEAIKQRYPDIPVIIMSGRDRATVIESCRKLGASDFIQRQGDSGAQTQREVLSGKITEYGLIEDQAGRIIGRSLPLLKTLAAARRAATGLGCILVLGESGTGKELLARYIHDNSPNRIGPYIIFEPHKTAESLCEDELFGHVKGAFTDAKTDRPGLFELADGGTLFIDEIGDIPEGLQNKLLRPIENRCVSRQGSEKEIRFNAQLVLATNKSLSEYSQSGRFKFDLLNRINAYTINLPSLADRLDDLPLLVESTLHSLCIEIGARWPRSVGDGVMERLREHDWKGGNVRELRNVLVRVVSDHKDSELLIASDIRFDSGAEEKRSILPPTPALPAQKETETTDHQVDWLLPIKNIGIPSDYEIVHGGWTALQRELAFLTARYLSAAIDVTKIRKAGDPYRGEVNLTGAASCVYGSQLTTTKAADFVKRALHYDDEILRDVFLKYPELNILYGKARKAREKKQGKDNGE